MKNQYSKTTDRRPESGQTTKGVGPEHFSPLIVTEPESDQHTFPSLLGVLGT